MGRSTQAPKRPENVQPEAVPRRRGRVRNGIFCVECTWWGRFDEPSSIRPMLELIGSGGGGAVPYIHRHADCRAAFDDYVGQWVQRKYSKYPILYLGFHGEVGDLLVGDWRRSESRVSLDDLEALLGSRCSGRIIHLGCCDGMSHHGRRLRSFASRLGAVAICGYDTDVDWIESAAFEALLFATLQGRRLDGRSFPAMIREMQKNYGSFMKRVGFKSILPLR